MEVPEVPPKERRKRMRQFVCDLCGAEMCDDSKVRHMAVHHEIYLGKKFTCETCGKVFWTTGQFNAHMRKHNNTETFVWSVCRILMGIFDMWEWSNGRSSSRELLVKGGG